MDIAEVARRSGLAASALRYYEGRGLIRPAARSIEARGGQRCALAPPTLDAPSAGRGSAAGSARRSRRYAAPSSPW